MDKYLERKKQILGMPFGTANARLRKAIMFDMAKKLKVTNCHRCGNDICDIGDFSIEHKVPWKDVDGFFDLENIGFSHLNCNVGAAHPRTKKVSVEKRERIKINKKKKFAIIDISNGVIYPNMTAASQAIGMKYDTLAHKLCGRDTNTTSLRYLHKQTTFKGRSY